MNDMNITTTTPMADNLKDRLHGVIEDAWKGFDNPAIRCGRDATPFEIKTVKELVSVLAGRLNDHELTEGFNAAKSAKLECVAKAFDSNIVGGTRQIAKPHDLTTIDHTRKPETQDRGVLTPEAQRTLATMNREIAQLRRQTERNNQKVNA